MPDTSDPRPDTPMAPGQQVDTPWIAPSTRKMAAQAVLVWLLLGVWLSGLQWSVVGTPAAPTDVLRRLWQLAGYAWMPVVAPALLCVPGFGVVLGQWQRGVKYGLNWSLSFFMTAALLWAGIGLFAAADNTDPWENLPGVTPPYLEAVVAAHPQLEVLNVNGTRRVRIRHRSEGGGMWVDGNDLAGSAARFERCAAPPTAEALGGLTVYPGATCKQVLTLTRPAAQRVIYMFELPQNTEMAAIRRHYMAWADARQAQGGFAGDRNRWDFKARQGSRQWDFWMIDSRGGWSTIYLEQGGRTLPWPQSGGS